MSCRNSIFLIFLVICINHAERRAFLHKIFGGLPAGPGEFPYMALIHGDDSIWSGAIISENHVLTSAALSAEFIIKPHKNVVVKIGSNKYEDLEIHHIKHITIHPKFLREHRKGMIRFDVAVITLCDWIDFNQNKQPAILPHVEVQDGETVFVVGWGLTDTGDVAILNKLSTKVYNAGSCFDEPIPDRSQICTKDEKGKGYCSGDGGSPLILPGNILVGIASIYNHICGNGKDIYTNIYECLDYIEAEIHPLTCRRPVNSTTVRSIRKSLRPFQ